MRQTHYLCWHCTYCRCISFVLASGFFVIFIFALLFSRTIFLQFISLSLCFFSHCVRVSHIDAVIQRIYVEKGIRSCQPDKSHCYYISCCFCSCCHSYHWISKKAKSSTCSKILLFIFDSVDSSVYERPHCQIFKRAHHSILGFYIFNLFTFAFLSRF